MEAGRVAPTACNYQPQRILVIEDAAAHAKLKQCTSWYFGAPIALMVCYDKKTCWKNKTNGTMETNISGDFEKDVSFDYDRFELDLRKLEGEEYSGCVLNADYDPTTVPAMKLIRLCTGGEIPEEFDAVNLIDRFKPMLMGHAKIETTQDIYAEVTDMKKTKDTVRLIEQTQAADINFEV